MEKFTTHTGVGVPLRRSNVDTDQIIPAVYLKRVTRTGFEDALFAAWRGDPTFVLNQDAYRAGSVLVAGPDFGTGSSREHAVWALKDYGFRVVLASRFADIFRGNSGKQGLVAGIVAQEDVELLWKILETNPGTEVTVDLVARTASALDVTVPFQIDDYTRWRLMEGLDDIGLTLQHADEISAFEATRASWRPKTLPAKTLPKVDRGGAAGLTRRVPAQGRGGPAWIVARSESGVAVSGFQRDSTHQVAPASARPASWSAAAERSAGSSPCTTTSNGRAASRPSSARRVVSHATRAETSSGVGTSKPRSPRSWSTIPSARRVRSSERTGGRSASHTPTGHTGTWWPTTGRSTGRGRNCISSVRTCVPSNVNRSPAHARSR